MTRATGWPRSPVTEAFVDDFFDRYVEGHEVVDYARLLECAGLVLRKRAPGRAWLGDVRSRLWR